MKRSCLDVFSIEDFQNGKESAFDFLFKDLYAPLCFFAHKMIHSEMESEELVQSAFVTLWEKHTQFDSLLKIKAFLYIAVKNAALNWIKKKNNQSKAFQYLLESDLHEEVIVEKIIYAEVLYALEDAIDNLPEKCRNVIRLSYIDEKSSKEIADLTGVSVSTVDNQRARGVKLLKKSLAKVGLFSFSLFIF